MIPRDDALKRKARDAVREMLPARGVRSQKLAEGLEATPTAHGREKHTIPYSEPGHSHTPLNNYTASAAPGVTDDSSAGYEPGSEWVDQTNDKGYVCLDATVGAAVWLETTQAAGGGSPHDILSATHSDTLAGAVVKGDVAIGNATPKWSRLGVGADGLVLTAQADGTVAWEAAAGGGDAVLHLFSRAGIIPTGGTADIEDGYFEAPFDFAATHILATVDVAPSGGVNLVLAVMEGVTTRGTLTIVAGNNSVLTDITNFTIDSGDNLQLDVTTGNGTAENLTVTAVSK